jgi:hypothetical protein
MQAILTKPLKRGIKTVAGTIIQDGMGYITLAVIDKHGSKSIKRFKKEDWSVRICNS